MKNWTKTGLILLVATTVSAADLSVSVVDTDARAEVLQPVLAQLFNSLAGDSVQVAVTFSEPQTRLASFGVLPMEITLQQPRQLIPGRQVVALLCCDADGFRSLQYLCVDATLSGTVAFPGELLKRGEKITTDNISLQEIELSTVHLRSAVLHPEILIGMEVVRHLSAGSPIRWDQVKPLSLIQKGDGVELVIDRSAFAIKASAVALEGGALGEEIWVRLKNNGKRMRAVVLDADHVSLE